MQFARVRAEEQAKRVEPAVLEQAVKENVEAQTFCFWARLCVYVHGRITPLLRSYLDERCPGFIDTISSQDTADLNDVVFWQKLRDWMEMHLFARAPSEGWRDALAYYTAAILLANGRMTAGREPNEIWTTGQGSKFRFTNFGEMVRPVKHRLRDSSHSRKI